MIRDHEWLDLAVKNAQRNIAECIANSVHLKPVEKPKYRYGDIRINWIEVGGIETVCSGGGSGSFYSHKGNMT